MPAGLPDGWYLSTYLTPPGISRILGVWPRHDNNVSLWRKEGAVLSLVRNWEIERQSGLKQHGAAFTTAADAWGFLEGLLESEGLQRGDLAAVWGTPGLHPDFDYPGFADDLPIHSISHLFSSVLLESAKFYEGRILGLAVDGLPDFFLDRTPHYYAGVYVDHGAPTFFPVESPGRLYDSAREMFGMRAGTLMALASASHARTGHRAEDILGTLEFWGVGNGTHGSPEVVSNACELVRRARALAEDALRGNDPLARFDERFTATENLVSMTMKLVQESCLRVMERNVARAVTRFHIPCSETRLALAGGFALNCPGNSQLMDRFGFKEFLAPPCVNDSGQSIGMALAIFYSAAKGERLRFTFPGPYLGPGIETPARLGGLRRAVESISGWDPAVFVADVQAGPVAWMEGKSEIGPRALGHRSLLADPTRAESKSRLNGLKRREWWRPVAPVALAEKASEWFTDAVDSPYMLRTFRIRPDRRASIPAVWHLDDSARLQTVRPLASGLLRGAIEAFDAATGVPMLCNTSLNDAGEPIVETVEEALTFCLRRRVPVLYVDGRRLLIRFDGSPAPTAPAPRKVRQFARLSKREHQRLEALLNPGRLSAVELYAYLERPALRRFDLTTPDDVAKLRSVLAELFDRTPEERQRITAYLEWVWQTFGPPHCAEQRSTQEEGAHAVAQ